MFEVNLRLHVNPKTISYVETIPRRERVGGRQYDMTAIQARAGFLFFGCRGVRGFPVSKWLYTTNEAEKSVIDGVESIISDGCVLLRSLL